MSSDALRPAIFLDRDGTIVRELEQPLDDPRAIELLPGAAAAAARMHAAGFALVIVTNQSAIAQGTLGFDALHAVHRELERQLELAGAPLAGIYLCPHHENAGLPPYRRACSCRKPASGLLRRAASELGLDLAASWVVGDAERDLTAGTALGVRGVLVGTGKGARELARLAALGRAPAHVAADLSAAGELILAAQGR